MHAFLVHPSNTSTCISGLTLPDAVSAVKENEAKLQQHTHSKKKRNRNKKKNGPHSHRPRPRISNYGTCLTQSSRAHDCMNANDSFSPKNSDHHGGGHHTSTRYKDPSHTVLDDFVQGTYLPAAVFYVKLSELIKTC